MKTGLAIVALAAIAFGLIVAMVAVPTPIGIATISKAGGASGEWLAHRLLGD